MSDLARGLLTVFDQSFKFKRLVRLAMGEKNLGNIDPNVFREPFPLVGKGVRMVNLRVEPFLKGETEEMVVARLLQARHVLESTGDLVGFLLNHPKEVEKWNWVFAAGRQKAWWHKASPSFKDDKRITGASVVGNYRRLWRCFHPGLQYDGPCGVLVSSPAK